MQVSQWGNSLAVRLPVSLVRALKLKAGDRVNLVPDKRGNLRVTLDPRKVEMIERMRSAQWPLPPDYKFDREEANAR